MIKGLWRSDIPASRVKNFSKLFELFVRKRSIHDGLLKLLKQVGSSFTAFSYVGCKKLSYFFTSRIVYNEGPEPWDPGD